MVGLASWGLYIPGIPTRDVSFLGCSNQPSTINHVSICICIFIYIYVYMSTRINHPTNQSVYKIIYIYIYIIQKQPEIPAIRSAFFTNPVPCHSWVLTGRWLLMEPKTSRFHRAGMYRYEFHVWNHFRIFVFKKMARNMCGVKLQCWKDYSVNAVGHSMFSLWMDRDLPAGTWRNHPFSWKIWNHKFQDQEPQYDMNGVLFMQPTCSWHILCK